MRARVFTAGDAPAEGLRGGGLRREVADEEVLCCVVGERHSAEGGEGGRVGRVGDGGRVAEAVVLLQDALAEVLEQRALV